MAAMPLQGEGQLPAQALSQLNRLQLAVDAQVPGTGAGLRPSRRRRSAHDFREHRLYVPGDDVRFVDWKASARQEHNFIRQGEDPKEATTFLLLDCSASMGWGEPAKGARMSQLAAALGYTTLSQQDRLVVLPLGPTAPAPLGPVSGKGQVPVLLQYLSQLTYNGQVDWPAAVRALAQRAHGGLVLILSDLLDAGDLLPVLERLPRPTWNVVVLQLLHEHELDPPVRGNYQMTDAESGQVLNYDINSEALRHYQTHLQQWLQRWEDDLRALHVRHCLLNTAWPLAEEIIPALRAAGVLVPA